MLSQWLTLIIVLCCLQLLEKLKREAAAVTDPSVTAAASNSGPGDARKVTLKLPSPPPCYSDVLIAENLAIGWGKPPAAAEAAQGAAVPSPVLSGVTATVRKGQRVLVLGPNGAGKSTLLKALAGRLEPWAGSVKQGEGVQLGKWGPEWGPGEGGGERGKEGNHRKPV
jgi:ATPase subunit of ABC transporter with duplicated ATPase domains